MLSTPIFKFKDPSIKQSNGVYMNQVICIFDLNLGVNLIRRLIFYCY